MVTQAPLSLEIPAHYHRRLLAAPVPRALAASGVRTWDLNAALRLAVICYLAQSERLDPPKLPAGVWIRAGLPTALAITLAHRAAAEHRSPDAIIRAAIALTYPNRDGAAAFCPPGVCEGRLRAQFGDLAPSYQETGRYR